MRAPCPKKTDCYCYQWEEKTEVLTDEYLFSPVAAMDADNITLQWVLFCCCDAIGDQEQMLMPGGEKREWLPLAEVINEQPLELRGAYETLHAWATPVLDERARSESVRFEPDRSDLPCLETKVAVGAERGVRLHLVSASRRGN